MYRLFLSVDMVGSTQFKATSASRGADGWLEIFRTFFANFPLMLAGQLGFEFLDEVETPAVEIWKAMGDEVIFTAEPESPEETGAILCALLRTMRLYEANNFEKLPLRLKGTAWLADFSDSNNIVLDIPELSSDDAAPHLDFIGPDLDLGFRLGKFARPASLVLSLDLVEVLLAAKNASRTAMYFVGSEELKGVMFGRPYPIVWMHEEGEGFDFMPWELEACSYCEAAVAAEPTSPVILRQQIEDMRLYLRKMHGIERPPISLAA